MGAKKSPAVWVPPNIARAGRVLRRPLLLGATLWTLAAPVVGQPLQPGITTSDGRHYLLDDGTIQAFSKDFSEQIEVDGDPVTSLYQGAAGWESSFLALTEKGLARVSAAGATPSVTMVLPGEGIKVVPWGDDFLAFAPKASEVLAITDDGQTKLSVPLAPLQSLEVVNSQVALARGDADFALFNRTVEGSVEVRVPESDLPFPKDQCRVAFAGGFLYCWSPQSAEILQLADRKAADPGSPYFLYGKKITLPETPTHGLRVLENGDAVAAGAASLYLLEASGRMVRLGLPAAIDEKSFAEWPMVAKGGGLDILISDEGKTRIVHLPESETASSQPLPPGKLLTTISPEPGKTGDTLLFFETSFEEPKLDEDGRPVLDLATGKPAAPLSVTGYRILSLQPDGHWVQVAEEPRSRLVGPIQRVGDRVIYATQTEPEHVLNRELELDNRYPYPAVNLQGRSLLNPSDVWALKKPRGESPSKDRLPEDTWPLLGPDGPLFVASEAGALLAIEPANGQVKWTSPELPIDDSSPLMLDWPDGFGVQVTESTGRALLRLDLEKGTVLGENTLNEFFFSEKWRHLLGVFIVCAALAYYIYAAGRRTLYIRRIAGLQALDEAVGRATEMGKPVLYVVGLADVDDIQTMASLSILSHVARKTAEYDTPIVTTTARAVAFSAAQEIVRDAFSVAGRPDAFSVESVRYISDDQFGYTAGVDGIMVREKPAANFYIGNFYAESLILAETGHATGSIQIAGTAQPSQVPFFVAACDYTLIGEELYAASAYLSGDPLQVGSLRGQDVGKAIVMVLLVVCSLLVSFGVDWAKISQWTGWNLP